MFIYRPQRRTLNEAMEEVQAFDTEEDLFRFVAGQYYGDIIQPENISLSEDSFTDERVGWENVHMLLVNRIGDEDFIKQYGCGQCIGFVNITKDGEAVILA